LGQTDYAETRFLRLLRNDPGTAGFADAWRRATDWLAVRATPIEWQQAHDLIIPKHPRDDTRRRLARDFYRAKPRDAA
jgi:hypothetical protein